jgi:3-hydroxyisobutyrate dehydrogenase
MNVAKNKIGWIGVGRMGRPMCINLVKAGFSVTVYDKDTAKIAAVLGSGVAAAASPAALAAQSDIVVSMIFDDAALQDVVLGPAGVLGAMRPGAPYVDMSTVSPAASEEIAGHLAERNVPYLRAPVSGTVVLAETAKLSTYVSGPKDVFEACLPVFQALTAKQKYVGEGEEARLVKLTINLIVQMATAVLGEALAFGTRAGLDRSMLVDAINDSIVASPHYESRAEWFKHRERSPVADLSMTTKDMDLALAVAQAHGAALPIASLVRQYLAISKSLGKETKGVMALAEILEDINPDHSRKTIEYD